MIWVHCGDVTQVTTTQSLVARLTERLGESGIIVTADAATIGALSGFPDVVEVPPDTPAKARAFLGEYVPDYLIWIGGSLRPALIRCVERAQIAAILINASIATLLTRGAIWRPGATRSAVAAFQRILTADGATATRLIRGGVPRDRIEASGPIDEEPTPTPHNQHELTVMAEAIGTRPVWFAADVMNAEVVHMAAAHLSASRKNHRLLMIITPRDINNGGDVAALLREAGLTVGVRSDGDDPDAEQQAYIADLADEMGLWYRLAPLSFMGGTLSGNSAVSPFDPILLGSAVIHGTHKAPFEAQYARLGKAEACREVRSAGELGIAVGALISPDQTARMALAGWGEITRNAETINALIAAAIEHLDNPEGTR